MYGDGSEDALLRESWQRFCDDLKHAGEIVFRDTAPRNPTARATGMRQLARNIALALQFELENADPLHPELLHYFDPIRKQGGDNPDAHYCGAPINGTDTYRVHGYRGSAAYFAVTVLEDGDTPWGGRVVGTLIDDEIEVDDDGRFELVVSPHRHEGNWIRSTPATYRITFRQFFSDWQAEDPMDARIERQGDTGPPPPLTAEKLREGLAKAAHWLGWSVGYWADMLDKWQARPNDFVSYGEIESNNIDFTPGGAPLIAYWKVSAEEACLIRVTPPRADYWAVEFGSYWWESMDYRYRLSSLNAHYAELEDDGSLLVVISHADPGVANWLDPSGHDEGYVTFRWIGADSYPRPSMQQVALSELDAALGDRPRRVTPERRRESLRSRRDGVIKRFRT